MKVEKLIISIFITGLILNSVFKIVSLPSYYPSIIAIFAIIILKHTDLLFKRSVVFSLLYLYLLMIYDLNTVYSELKMPLGLFSLFLPYLMVLLLHELIYKVRNQNIAFHLGKTVFYSMAIMSAISVWTLINNPIAARMNFDSGSTHYNHSFLGFYFIQFCIVLPFITESKINKNLLIFCSAINFFALMLAGLSTAIVVFFLCVLLVILIRNNNKNFLYKTLLFIIFFAVVSAYRFLLDILVRALPEEIRAAKLAETDSIDFSSFETFLQSYRYGVYYDSWLSFSKFPIWGNDAIDFGRHSAILDKLGLFGLVGTFFFSIFYFILFNNASKKILSSGRERKFFNYSMFVIFIELLLNPLDIYYTEFFVYYGLFLPVVIKFVSVILKSDTMPFNYQQPRY